MNKNKLLDKLFLIIVSVQTILMGILFVVQVLRIYFGNEATFTREICGEYILQILPVIIIWIIVIIVSYFYFYKRNISSKEVAKITNITKLKNLENICPEYSEELKNEYNLLNKEKKKRKIFLIINFVVLLICSIMGLCYLLNTKHFKSSGDLTKQAIDMSVHLLPWAIISFGVLIGYAIYEEYSAKKSIEIIKGIIKSNGKKENFYYENKGEKNNILIARISITSIAVILIIVGVINGGAYDVLQKAINICTECIGLG